MIVAKHYNEVARELSKDPIVIEMAMGVPPGVDIPAVAAMHEFHARGGKARGHIGAVKEAIEIIHAACAEAGVW